MERGILGYGEKDFGIRREGFWGTEGGILGLGSIRDFIVSDRYGKE